MKKKTPPAIRRIARQFTGDAILEIVSTMYDPKESRKTRLKAANDLLKWGWGVPGSDLSVQQADDPHGDLLMDEDLYGELRQTFKKIQGLSEAMHDSLTGAAANADRRVHRIIDADEDIRSLPEIEKEPKNDDELS